MDLDETFVMETKQSLAEFTAAAQRILLTEWTGPDAWANGYPVYRTNWKDSWIWVSLNEAPKGFVRKDHERYEELKGLIVGTALRYPELPEKAVLIKVAEEGVAEPLRQLLAEHEMELRAAALPK